MSSTEKVSLLLAGADTGLPVLEQPLSWAQASTQPAPVSHEETQPTHLGDRGADPNRLPIQFWEYLYPHAWNGDALREALAPLLMLRSEQMGRAAVGIPVPEDVVLSAQGSNSPVVSRAARRLRQTLDERFPLERDRPRFLLLLGELHELSFELQQHLARDYFVGRLGFSHPDGSPDFEAYRVYAEKVVRFERALSPSDSYSCRLVQYSVSDGTDATEVGYQELMLPLSQAPALRFSDRFPVLEAQRTLRRGTDAADLLALASDSPDRRTLLFTLSHGMGAPRGGWGSAQAQRRGQGSLCLGQLEPREKGERRETGQNAAAVLEAEQLRNRPFLPGGFWFKFACFSAGVPKQSVYWHWLRHQDQLWGIDKPYQALQQCMALERPFLSASAQAALSNPEGPVGMIGHVDLAWSHSFQRDSAGASLHPPLEKFTRLLEGLAGGHRMGVAFHSFLADLNPLDEVLAQLTSTEERNRQEARLAHQELLAGTPLGKQRGLLWMVRQDLSCYMLLGDPAVQLTRRPGELTAFRARARREDTSPSAAGDDKLLECLEGAILQQLRGEEALAARQYPRGMISLPLRQLAQLYREAGRAALREALAKASGGPMEQ